MAELHGRVFWPGVRSPVSCSYTMSQGVTPGAAVLRMLPQPGLPFAPEGTLTITDGAHTIRLPRSRVDRVEEKRTGSGVFWDVTIIDRRWRWRDTGSVSLFANQLDPHGKFIPWTVASPVEIAKLCLQAQGETRFTIDLPVGLTSALAKGIKEFLPTGVNFPPSGVNPPIDWVCARPMTVLEQLADMFGRVVVWDWRTDSVHVVQRGAGPPLPPGSLSSRCPGLDSPEVPDGVTVVGAPTRYQADFELTAVGEEWDGKLKPINDLSYAPLLPGAKHKVEVTGLFRTGFRYYVEVTDDSGTTVATVFSNTPGNTNINEVVTTLAQRLNDPDFAPAFAGAGIKVRVGAGDKLELEAKAEGPKFEVRAYTHWITGGEGPYPPQWVSSVVRVGANGGKGWQRSWPPLFNGVRATERLTLGQARDLARKSVWKYFKLSGRDVSGKGKIIVPGVGRCESHQIVLLPTQCEQIVPEQPDFNIRLKNGLGDPLVQNFYDGLSKDKPAACYGSVNKRAAEHLMFVLDKKKGLNTEPDEQVQVPFSIDSTYQVVKFSAPVFRHGASGTLVEPDLRLRTACNVRNKNDNALLRFTLSSTFPGGAGRDYTFEVHEDVQLNVIPTYNDKGQVTNLNLLELDPIIRAGYYRAGMIARYQTKASLVNVYNGIVALALSGSVAQITWSVNESGAETTAGLNFEHNTAVPPFPARRRAELLRSAAKPGGFMGQIGDRKPNQPVPFQKP